MTHTKKLIVIVVLSIVSVCLLAGVVVSLFQTWDQPAKEANPVILPLPIPSPDNNDQNTNNDASLQLAVDLSQFSNATNHFNFSITPSNMIKINVNLTSTSKDTNFTTPLYLSVGAFNNQPSPKIITSAPSPYPVLPWPPHEDSPNAAKPFEASFDSNPVILAPNESKTAILTITALENAQPGVYTMLIEMGNWKETGLGGVTFQLTVSSN